MDELSRVEFPECIFVPIQDENTLDVNWKPDFDFNFASQADSYEQARLKQLLKRKDFCLTREDLRVAKWLVGKYDTNIIACLKWIMDGPNLQPFWTSTLKPIGSQMCVYHYLLEEFGVIARLYLVHFDRFGQINWWFNSFCPFHRRVHSKQHWYLSSSKNGGVYIGCFHKSPGMIKNPNYFLCDDLPGFE